MNQIQPTKFVCADTYRQFRGYVFALHKPTVVMDRATIAACDKDPSFERVDDGKAKEGQRETTANAEVLSVNLPTCRFCSRQMTKGLFVHERYCKSNPEKQG